MCDNVSDSGKMDDWTYLGFPLVHRIRCSRTTLELGRNIGEKEKPKTSFFTLRKIGVLTQLRAELKFRDKAYLQSLQISWPSLSEDQALGAACHVKVCHNNEYICFFDSDEHRKMSMVWEHCSWC